MTRGRRGSSDPDLTPKQFEDMARWIRMGLTVKDTCLLTGTTTETFYKWLRIGKERPKSDHLRVFADAVVAGKASAKAAALAQIHMGMKKDWKAAAWFLSVTDPANYGPQIKITVKEELDAVLEKLAAGLPSAEYARVLAIIGSDDPGESEIGSASARHAIIDVGPSEPGEGEPS